jgi:hypothetical protein
MNKTRKKAIAKRRKKSKKIALKKARRVKMIAELKHAGD